MDPVETDATVESAAVVETAATDAPAVQADLAEEKPDRAALVASVADRLAKQFGETVDDAPEKTVAAEVKPATDDKTETETKADEAAEVENKDTNGGKPAVKPDPTTPTLPAAYRRSLQAYEWSDAEIDAAMQSGGDSFITTAAKIHANRNKELQSWAQAGRAARPQSETQKDATSQPVQFVKAPSNGMAKLDVAALKARYGEEAIIDDLVGPINGAIDQINQMLPMVQQTQQRAVQHQQEALAKQIDSFFGGKDMKPYNYGTAINKLDQTQLASRTKVLELADAIISGAKLQGQDLTVDEGLQLAHDSVTGGLKEQAARTAITNTLQQRNKGITLKPSGSKPAAAVGPGASRSELEKAVTQRLANAFSGS